MVTTTIALVFFTVFVQGMTIGPLVRILNVKTSNKQKLSMNERIITKSIDHLMAAIEDIIGQKMGSYHLRDKFKYYNNKYLRPLLIREHANAEPKIFETYSKLNLADAMDIVKRNSSTTGLSQLAQKEKDGLSSQASFSSLFQVTMDKRENKGAHSKMENESNVLNVDIAELEYSPSYKDMADAELHHILADAMARSNRRRRSSRMGFNNRKVSNDLSSYGQWRPHARYFSNHQRSRRYRSGRSEIANEENKTRYLAPPDFKDGSISGSCNRTYQLRPPSPEWAFVISPPNENDEGIFFSAGFADSQGTQKTANEVDYFENALDQTNEDIIDSTTHCSRQHIGSTQVVPQKLLGISSEREICQNKYTHLNQTVLRNRRHSDPCHNHNPDCLPIKYTVSEQMTLPVLSNNQLLNYLTVNTENQSANTETAPITEDPNKMNNETKL